MSNFAYWMDGVGFVSRSEVKRMITSRDYGFTGFYRRIGISEAYTFLYFKRGTHLLEIRDFSGRIEDKISYLESLSRGRKTGTHN